MSILSRAILVLALLSAVTFCARLYANTITPQIGGGISQFDGGISSQGAAAAPGATGKILLVDGASHLLQVDGTSKICIAGGC